MLGLLVGPVLSDVAFVGVEDRAAKDVQLLAPVELTADASTES
jgi:hypothetical protein